MAKEKLSVSIFVLFFQVSPDGKQFSVTSPDRRIRVFWFTTGKLRRVYDESLEVMLILYLNLSKDYIRLLTALSDKSLGPIKLGGPRSPEK